jgi:hypothetical protein
MSNATNFFPGNGNRYYFGVGIRTVAPFFDVTLTGFYQFGFSDTSLGVGTGSLSFISTNGSNWICSSRNNNITTNFDTGVSITDTDWKDFAFLYYENGDRVDFFINSVRVVTFWSAAGTNDPTNIYSANINKLMNRAGVKAMVHRVSTTGTNVAIDLDYLDFGVKYSTTVASRFNPIQLL